MSLTFQDVFCGAGGSSVGATLAGGELTLGLNHWRRAVETHATNFPDADHDCADVSALTTERIRRYPDADVLLASPECVNHSLSKGALRRKPTAASLFDDGPAGDDEQDRSRATMWDVCRFAEQKLIKGKPYKAIIVENVVDAYRWGYQDDGGLFRAWLSAMHALGYRHEIVWLNSMFCPPTPQSRDRMYVVFWRRGMRTPDLRVEPSSWCPSCERIVEGRQTWKRLGPHGGTWGRYGTQYYYTCPACRGTVLPGAFPAASILDSTLPTPVIGERNRPLAKNTRERIRRGLERLSTETFAIRLLRGREPRPPTLPLVSLTAHQDMAMVMPVAGNTHESTPGNRAKDASVAPLATVHATLDRALVMANTQKGVPRPVEQPTQTLRTEGGLALVYANRAHGVPRPAAEAPTKVVCGGGHLGVVLANYSPGWARRSGERPVGSITTVDGHALVVPYRRTGRTALAGREPVSTVDTRDRFALLVPETHDADSSSTEIKAVTDDDIDACGFRMFAMPEIAGAMGMTHGPDGSPYVVLGNLREQARQYGNAVTPKVEELLFARVAEICDEAPA